MVVAILGHMAVTQVTRPISIRLGCTCPLSARYATFLGPKSQHLSSHVRELFPGPGNSRFSEWHLSVFSLCSPRVARYKCPLEQDHQCALCIIRRSRDPRCLGNSGCTSSAEHCRDTTSVASRCAEGGHRVQWRDHQGLWSGCRSMLQHELLKTSTKLH